MVAVSVQTAGQIRAGLEEFAGRPISLGDVRFVVVPEDLDAMNTLFARYLMSETKPLVVVQTFGGLEEKTLDLFEEKARFVHFRVRPRQPLTEPSFQSSFRLILQNIVGLEDRAIQEEDLLLLDRAFDSLA